MRTGIRIVLAGFFVVAGCARPGHDGGSMEVGNAACATCHLPDYLQTANASLATNRSLSAPIIPDHPALNYSTTCESCHSQASWSPASSGMHNEAIFPTGRPSKHANILCQDCHNLSISTDFKANPDCTSVCHTQSWFPSHPGGGTWDATNHQFCRSCHPDGGPGTAGGLHPESLFPIGTGVHAGIACASCHNTALSSDNRLNQDCTATCHTATNSEGFMTANTAVPSVSNHHNGATFSTTSTTFCMTCHPSGQLASAILNADGTLTALGTSNHTFNMNHQGANGVCTKCHNAVYSPTDPLNQPDFSQDQDCTGGGQCHGSRRGG